MGLLDKVELLSVKPERDQCGYAGSYATAWRCGWDAAVAACNAEYLRREFERLSAEPKGATK